MDLTIQLIAEVDQAVKEVQDAVKVVDKIAPAADKASGAVTRMEKTSRDVAGEMRRAKDAADKLTPAVSDIGRAATQTASKMPEVTRQSGTLRTQLTALREEISRMEIAGQTGSKAFQQLSLEAARLQDQIGDTQARTRALASDTANVDAAIGGLQALANVGQIGAGAMALFGEENEEVGRVLLKLNGIMAITQGVQQVMNLLNKDSIVILKAQQLAQTLSAKGALIFAAAQRALGGATAATTVQVKVLRAALISTGIGALVVGVGFLIERIIAWASATEDNTEAQDKLNKEIELQAKLLESQAKRISESTEDLILAAKARGASERELIDIQRKGLKEQIALQSEALGVATEGSEAQTKAAEKLREATRNLSRFELEQKAKAIEANKSRASSASKTAKEVGKAIQFEEAKIKQLTSVYNGINENIDVRISREEALRQAIINRRNEEIKAANDARLSAAEALANPAQGPLDISNIGMSSEVINQANQILAVQSQLGQVLQNNELIAAGLANQFGNIFEAIANGQNAFDVIKDSLRQLVVQIIRAIIQAAILKALTSAIGGSTFGGSFIGKSLLGALGGNRAGGGMVMPGMSYTVGEMGAETFIPSVPGSIVPAGGGMGGQFEFVISGNTLRTVQQRANQSFNRIRG